MSNRKDEILNQILNLKNNLQQQREEYERKAPKLKELKSRKNSVEEALKQIRQQYQDISADYQSKSNVLDHITRQGKLDKAELERLQRELGRLTDAEAIEQKYLAQVQAFKDSCLDAKWRAENRSDGMGALTHQIEGAIHLAVAGQALLGDKRGLGKTLTSLIWCDFKEAKRVIAVCPSDTMDNFIREVQLWTSHRAPIKLGKMDKFSRDFLLPNLKNVPQYMLVVNYEAWRRDPQLIEDLIDLEADTLILDEAHRIKTMSTNICKGIMDIRFGVNTCPSCRLIDEKARPSKLKYFDKVNDLYECDDCTHQGPLTDFCTIKNVLEMTGTPILNKPQELFPQLRLISPENFKSVNHFLRDFCVQTSNAHWTWQWGAEKKLMEKIGPRYLARDRKAAGVIIPPALPVDHIITMAELEENYSRQFKAYKQARDYAQLILDPDQKIAMSMVAKITVLLRLRQVLTWPAAIRMTVAADNGLPIMDVNLDVHESAKLDKSKEIIEENIDCGERTVLFSQFKGPLKELQRRFKDKAVVYDGDTPSFVRNDIQLDFDIKTAKDKPRWDVVLCNYKAAGEGLNFNAATRMTILDKEWNPGRQSQAEGRIDRLGQTKETQIDNIVVANSVDTWMQALIDEKRDLIAGFETEASVMQRAYDALRNGEM
jgi:SNF2 family DNA or RNA helicase